MTALGRSFRGQRGRVLLRESVAVTAAGGPDPQADWRPQDVTPDLSRAMTAETLSAARDSICTAFGVLPSLFASAARSEEHTSELQSLMRISYAVFCLKKKKKTIHEQRQQR